MIHSHPNALPTVIEAICRPGSYFARWYQGVMHIAIPPAGGTQVQWRDRRSGSLHHELHRHHKAIVERVQRIARSKLARGPDSRRNSPPARIIRIHSCVRYSNAVEGPRGKGCVINAARQVIEYLD